MMDATSAAMRRIATNLDKDIQKEFGRQLGFMLVVFEFGKPGISNYISNGRRSDCIKAMRETADKLESKEDIPPTIGEA